MKNQIENRLGLPHVHDAMAQFCEGKITWEQACESLGISRSRLYELRTGFLKARAGAGLAQWHPGISGGNHARPWPAEIEQFAREVIASGYNYAFVASETERLFGKVLARSQIRHWAIRSGCVPAPKPPRLPSHIRRWQRGSVGELWQLDATPEHWFGAEGPALPLLDMLDDCSRQQVGCAIYRSENIPAYLHFLHAAFMKYGLPLEIYVDQATIFKGNKENSVTRLGRRLKFYGSSFVLANTPEAKGKVERIHQVWQDRLPPYFEYNDITASSDLETVNCHIDRLRDHRNHHEKHRELKMCPQDAWDKAIAEGRNKLRPVPQDPWWPYVWSTWYDVTIGQGGYVCWGNERFPTRVPPGSRAVLCEHLDGKISIIKEYPNKERLPQILFTCRPT